MTAPLMLRVLDSKPMSSAGAPNEFRIYGSTKLLNAKNAPAPTEPPE